MANKVWNNPYTIEEKEQIINKIKAFKDANDEWFDNTDFSYLVKMLLENGKVRVSKEAYKVIQCYDVSNTRFSKEVRKKLEKGEKQDEYLQEKTHGTKKNWGIENELCWEHVVPTAVLVNLFESGVKLNKIIELGDVCIVLKSEDSRLNKKYRDSMPKGWDKPVYDKWKRYEECEVEVLGVTFKKKK